MSEVCNLAVRCLSHEKSVFTLRITCTFCDAASLLSSTVDEQRVESHTPAYLAIIQGHIQGSIFVVYYCLLL
jgi:arginine exporter protein ArgO